MSSAAYFRCVSFSLRRREHHSYCTCHESTFNLLFTYSDGHQRWLHGVRRLAQCYVAIAAQCYMYGIFSGNHGSQSRRHGPHNRVFLRIRPIRPLVRLIKMCGPEVHSKATLRFLRMLLLFQFVLLPFHLPKQRSLKPRHLAYLLRRVRCQDRLSHSAGLRAYIHANSTSKDSPR